MYKRPSITTLEALRFRALALSFGLFSAFGVWPALAEPTVIIEIPDRPVSQAPDADGGEDEAAPVAEPPPPPPPQDLFIVEAINQALDTPALYKSQHPDDIAAVKSFYQQHTGPALWLTSAGFSPRGLILLEVFSTSDNWGLEPSLFRVPPTDYRPEAPIDQAKTELAISLAALKYARAAQGGLGDPKTVSEIYGMAPSVQKPRVLMTEIAKAPALDQLLTGYHPPHEQFGRLRKALPNAKSEAEDMRLRRNMDRWRWMPATLEPSYVLLNIPAFTIEAVEDGKTVQSEKAIVGAIKTPTPVLRAEMTEIVINPEEIVPTSVVRRHVLPKLRSSGSFFGNNSTAILDKYKLVVKRRGKVVDPKTIDWKKVNPSTLTFVRSKNGGRGRDKVQFIYPNDSDVMMRDATVQSQLARESRSLGGKDPRVANAKKFAAYLLTKSNDLTETKARQITSSSQMNKVKLSKPVPVYMTYFTASVDEDGTVTTFEDVYKLDALKMPEVSTGRSAEQDSSPAPSSVPVPVRKPTRGSRTDRSLATTTP